jgi:NAD(P)H dehydrogenase (quinone)
MNRILVTGATGHYGTATIDFLLKKGIPATHISALVRDEAKAADLKTKSINIKVGDYNDYESLTTAFQGIDKLLLVSGNEMVNRDKIQANAVNAAKEAGIQHIVYTSFERKNETATSPINFVAASHLSTEQHIEKSGVPYTFLRNNLYIDVLPMFMGEQVLETGVFFPTGEGRTAFAARNDMAEATAHVLSSEGHENRAYSFSNTEKVSFQEIADMLSNISGKVVPYIDPMAAVYTDTLTKTGVPAEYIGLFAGFAEAIKQGEFDHTSTDLEHLLGRKPVTVKDFLTAFYSGK